MSSVPLRPVPQQAPTYPPVTKQNKAVTYVENEVPKRVFKEKYIEEKPKYKTVSFEAEPIREVTITEKSTPRYAHYQPSPRPTPAPSRSRYVENVNLMPVRVTSKPVVVEQITRKPVITVFQPTEIIEMTSTTLSPKPNAIYITTPTPATILRQYQPNEVIIEKSNYSSGYHLRLDFTCDGINAYYSVAGNCDKFVECKVSTYCLY